MAKKEVEKKLKSLAKKMQKTYLEYLDSLEEEGNEVGKEEGNEVGKEEGYLSIAIFRDSINIDSTHDNTELKEENQICWFHLDR